VTGPRETIDQVRKQFDARLARHRNRILPVRVVAARPRFFIAAGVGAAAGYFAPEAYGVVTRSLIGWNCAVVVYLALVGASIAGASHRLIRHQAQMLDDGRFLALALSILAASAAIGAIVTELGAAKGAEGLAKAGHLSLAACTILSSWAFIHMAFALHYAHEYYLERELSGEPEDLDGDGDVDDDDAKVARDARDPRGGLEFPGTPDPIYADFVYFSYIVGVAAQTADVEITTRAMRRISLAHSILSFFFNTALLALTINIASGLF
jgi:uncharacterized membrane protein